MFGCRLLAPWVDESLERAGHISGGRQSDWGNDEKPSIQASNLILFSNIFNRVDILGFRAAEPSILRRAQYINRTSAWAN